MSDKSVLMSCQISSSGWKLVPVEPTEEMLNAIFENHWQWPDDADLDDVAATSELATKELAELRAVLAKAREVIELALYVADLCGGTWESMAKEALNAIEQITGAQRWNLAWAGEEGKESK